MPRLFSWHGPCLHPTASMDVTSPPSDILVLFERFSTNGTMQVSQFCRFLTEIQREPRMSETQASQLMASQPASLPGPQFSADHFLSYLLNTELNFAINNCIHHDMSLPLSNYFIFTGHNSYLTGNQLSSACSEQPIGEALRRGVRVVELDLWPNSQGDEILVYHGRTMTSPVEFQKCLTAIKENAFIKSEYPVVITLEDHLTKSLQAKAAKVILETFGSQLFYSKVGEEWKQFPSPESLKRRILISTKPPKEYLLSTSGDGSPEHENRELGVKGEKAEEKEIHEFGSLALSSEDEDSDDEYEGECFPEANKVPEQGTHEVPEYKRIIAIRAARKCKSSVNALKAEETAKRVSLSEPKLSKVASSHHSMVVRFTQNNILRIYPKATRVDSSNYNPFKAWLCGAQMVALNMQGYGKNLWITQGFFRANGGCGYVRKPSFFMSESGGFQLDSINSKDTTIDVKLHLRVKVCMGIGWCEQLGKKSFDKFSPPDFYTRVGIAGVKADKIMKKTSTVYDKWEPTWDEEFHFALRVPELAVLRIEVLEEDRTSSEFAGQICLPVSELKSGYRVIFLCDKKGNEWELVKLLLHLHISVPATETR